MKDFHDVIMANAEESLRNKYFSALSDMKHAVLVSISLQYDANQSKQLLDYHYGYAKDILNMIYDSYYKQSEWLKPDIDDHIKDYYLQCKNDIDKIDDMRKKRGRY